MRRKTHDTTGNNNNAVY